MKLECLIPLNIGSLETVNSIKRRKNAQSVTTVARKKTQLSSENAEGVVSEIQAMTQEAVNEHIIWFIAPLTRQLEKLTRLVQGMATTQRPNYYPRIEFGTTSGTVTHQSNKLGTFVVVSSKYQAYEAKL